MRRESSTVVALVGEVDDSLLAGLTRSPNVSVVRPAAADTDGQAANEPRPGWQRGAAAMRQASRLRATYVLVPVDPLAEVAADWQAMWDVSAQTPAAAAFEARAADALAAWRDKQFELPDYYLVIAPAIPPAVAAGPDMYLGPLRSVRPNRVSVAAVASGPGQTAHLADALRELEHGPWWPPLDELLEAARRFYAGGLS